jgi:hypothetical protein
LPSLKCFFEQIRKDRKFTNGALIIKYFLTRDTSGLSAKVVQGFSCGNNITRSGKR